MGLHNSSFNGTVNNAEKGLDFGLDIIHRVYNSIFCLARKHKLMSGLIFAILLLAVFKPVFFVLTLFVILGAFSTIYKIIFNIGFDLELQSFFTILAGVLFGPKAGMLVGLLSVLIGHSINFMLVRNLILSGIYAISFAILGLIAGVSSLNHIVLIGTMYILANDVLFIFLGTMFGAPLGRMILAAIIHPIFVYMALSKVLIPVLGMFGGA